MINVSPVGRNASIQERNDYEKYDKQHKIRAKFVEALKENFGDFGLTYVALFIHRRRLMNTIIATQLADKSHLMYFPLAGIKPTACNT